MGHGLRIFCVGLSFLAGSFSFQVRAASDGRSSQQEFVCNTLLSSPLIRKEVKNAARGARKLPRGERTAALGAIADLHMASLNIAEMTYLAKAMRANYFARIGAGNWTLLGLWQHPTAEPGVRDLLKRFVNGHGSSMTLDQARLVARVADSREDGDDILNGFIELRIPNMQAADFISSVRRIKNQNMKDKLIRMYLQAHIAQLNQRQIGKVIGYASKASRPNLQTVRPSFDSIVIEDVPHEPFALPQMAVAPRRAVPVSRMMYPTAAPSAVPRPPTAPVQARGAVAATPSRQVLASYDIDEVLRQAEEASSRQETDAILLAFLEQYINNISASELEQLMNAAATSDGQDSLGITYVNHWAQSLSVDDFKTILGYLQSDATNQAIETYVAATLNNLSVDDVVELVGQTTTTEAQDAAVEAYVSFHVANLSVDEMVQLAGAASSDAGDRMVLTWVEVHKANLTLDHVKALVEATRSGDTDQKMYMILVQGQMDYISVEDLIEITDEMSSEDTDEVIIDFVRSQQGRLRVRDLQKLYDNVRNSRYEEEIQAIIDER